MRRECWERFPHHRLQRQPLVIYPARDTRAVMHVATRCPQLYISGKRAHGDVRQDENMAKKRQFGGVLLSSYQYPPTPSKYNSNVYRKILSHVTHMTLDDIWVNFIELIYRTTRLKHKMLNYTLRLSH